MAFAVVMIVVMMIVVMMVAVTVIVVMTVIVMMVMVSSIGNRLYVTMLGVTQLPLAFGFKRGVPDAVFL